MSTEERTDERTGVNWVQVIAAALAAMSSAVLLSTLGVAGTIVGAAVGSLSASVGSALYARTLDVSRQQVLAQASALRRVAQARSDVDAAAASVRRGDDARTTLRRADQALSEAEEALADPAADTTEDPSAPPGGTAATAADAGEPRAAIPGWKERFPWKRIVLLAVAVFVAVMIAITAFELVTGRAVSTYTGGTDSDKRTSVPGLGGAKDPAPAKTADPSGPADPTDGSSPSTPESPSETPSESPTTEPGTSTPSPTELPSPSPSPSITIDPSAAASAG